MSLDPLAKRAAAAAAETGFVHLEATGSADGILAAAVLAHALDRAGIPFAARFSDAPGAQAVEPESFRFVLDAAPAAASPPDRTLWIHRGLAGDADGSEMHPRLGGYDGSTEASVAALAWLVARYLGRTEPIEGAMALTGAFACRQHLPELAGLHAALAQELAPALVLSPAALLAEPRPETLASSIDPYLAGIGGKARAARALLDEAGSELASALALRLVDQGASARAILAAHRPRLRFAEQDLGTLAFQVEAAAAAEGPEIALAGLLGESSARERFVSAGEAAVAETLAALVRVETQARSAGGLLVLRDGGRLARLRAALASDYLCAAPVLALGAGRAWLFARASHAKPGLSAVVAAREAARAVGGAAEGTDLESRARVPPGAEEAFVKAVEGAFPP
ncbi:MAG TPA: hypothetical protein VM681_08920 [Candidatus Thermoplasmatota archaeon]|nr:hypothetical protein [Candidatus Thermoplasmatota archaeon]